MNTRPKHLPPVEGFDEEEAVANSSPDALVDGMQNPFEKLAGRQPPPPSREDAPTSPAAGGMSALGPADKKDLDSAIGSKLSSQPPPPPPGSQMSQGGPSAPPPAMPAPMSRHYDDEQADNEQISKAADRDRMNRMLRGFETASKQLTAGVLQQPVAETVGQDSNYEQEATARAERNRQSRRAGDLDERNFSVADGQRKIALAHQQFLEKEKTNEDTAKGEKVAYDAGEDRRKAGLADNKFTEDKRHNLINEGIQDRRNAAIATAAAGGKIVPAGEVKDLGDIDSAKTALGDLLHDFGELKMGGMEGKAGRIATKALDLQDSDSAKFNASKAPVQQAVGAILEGGKLAAGDEHKYDYMFPRGGDSDDVAKRKVEKLNSVLDDIKSGRIKSFKDYGYKTPGAPHSAEGKSGASGGKAHSQDAEAITWAKAHSSDPRAVKILKLHGGS